MVVVDEAQDMTTVQLAIAKGMLNPDGNIVVVGDDKQAIFAFRGADSEALDNLKRELNADELGLTTTYRCGKNIVALAQNYVADFRAADTNADGVVSECSIDAVTGAAAGGDFILSRVNAPLVSIAMKLLRSGKRARVAGRDIGAGLRNLVRKLKARSIPELLAKLEAWRNKESRRIEAQIAAAKNGRKAALNAKLEAIEDQAEMLASLVDGASSVSDIEARIEALFTDDGLGDAGMIVCSSVHRSKGLEAKRVFVLRDTLRSNSQEELNICYVAITRAKHELVFVGKKEAA
jgi:superfamily I DNA/RNA helicase